MPIDFDAIAAAFSAPLDHELRQLQPIFKRLGDVFDDGLKDVEERARKMRAYPLLDFHGDALTVTLAGAQLGLMALPTGPQSTLGARMLGTVTGAADRFVAGLGWISTAVSQELIIPRTVEIPAQALDAILASLERFRTPTAAMFDPRQRTVSDLFGELGLAFRALGDDRDKVKRFADGVWAMRFANLIINPPDSAASGAEVPLPERLRALGSLILDAMLVLPLVSELVLVGLAPVVETIKLGLLQRFAELEAQGDRFRAAAVDVVVRGVYAGASAERFVQAAGAIFPTYVTFATRFTELWAGQVLAGVQDYLTAVSTWVRNYTDWMATIQSVLDGLMDINLTPFLLVAIGVPPAVLAILPDPPSFTLGDLIDLDVAIATSRPARWALRQWLGLVAGAAGEVPFVGDSLADRVHALSEALDILLTPTATPPEARLPSIAPFPDIGAALFGGGRDAALGAALLQFGEAARSLISGTLRTAATAVADLGAVGADTARRAASIDTSGRFAEIARRAHDQAAGAFARPLGEVQSELDGQGPDVLANTFESAVADGGILAAAAGVPLYVAEVRRYWEQRQPPTSPHILARHRRIERVRMPRMVIHVADRTPDSALADEIALRVHAAAGDAYDAGLARLGAAA
jgi:hypothetical protein